MLDCEINRRNPVLLAFLDLEGDQEAFLCRVVFGQRGHHLNVGKTMLQVIAANQVAIGFDAVGIVDVGCCRGSSEIRFRVLMTSFRR